MTIADRTTSAAAALCLAAALWLLALSPSTSAAVGPATYADSFVDVTLA